VEKVRGGLTPDPSPKIEGNADDSLEPSATNVCVCKEGPVFDVKRLAAFGLNEK
jgi:hypothetical protein